MKSFIILSTFLLTNGAFAQGYACVGNYLYNPEGEKEYVGSNCSTAKVGNGYACVGNYLYMPNGKKDYVGSSSCEDAKIGNGYACIGNYLYNPKSEKEYVGGDCKTANL